MVSNGIGDLNKFEFIDGGMYPGSQIDHSAYANPTQIPLAAQAVRADYDPETNPLTGEATSRFAKGGDVESNVDASFGYPNSVYMDPAYGYAHDPAYNAAMQSRSEGVLNRYQSGNRGELSPEEEEAVKIRAMIAAGNPKYDPRYMPLRLDDRPLSSIQAAMMRLQADKQIGEGNARAGISALAAALPNRQGVTAIPGAYDVGYNTPVGPGNLDISAYRAMKAMPTGSTPTGAMARYSIPFNEGGIASFKQGGSPFADDPKNLTGAVTRAYQQILGRDPSPQELSANVAGLQKDINSYTWLTETLADSPEAAKFHADDKTPKLDIYGEPVVDTNGNQVYAYDPVATANQAKAGYGNYVQTDNMSGIGKIGEFLGSKVLPYGVAASMLYGAGAALGAGTGTSSFGIGNYGPVATGVGSIAPEASAAGLSLTGSAASPAGIAATDAAAKLGVSYLTAATAEGMTAEKALMTKMLLDSATGSAGGQAGTNGNSTTTTPIPFTTNQNNPNSLQYNPNATNTIGGMSPSSPYYGYAPLTFNYEPSIKPMALKAPELGYRARTYAQGGIADLGGYAAGGKLLKGPGDGMSDSIVANIGGKQPARLADGEFVIPADVVSHLGNGSTDAGAKQLYKMLDRIRHARTGNKKQGKQINPNKFLPKG